MEVSSVSAAIPFPDAPARKDFMADQRSVLKEYRLLEQKRQAAGLTPQEEARFVQLRDLVGTEAGPAAGRTGFDVNAAAARLRESLLPAGLRNRPPPIPEPAAEPTPEPEPAFGEQADLAAAWNDAPFAPLSEPAQGGLSADALFDPESLGLDAAPYDPDAPQYDANAQQPLDAAAQPVWDPNAQPYDPNAVPYDPNAQPYDPNAVPYDPSAQLYDPAAPYDPNAQPYDPNAVPYDPNAQPYDPNAVPYDPNAQPYDPNAVPYDPNAQPYDPNAVPYDPNAQPYDPNAPLQWDAAMEPALDPNVQQSDPGSVPLDANGEQQWETQPAGELLPEPASAEWPAAAEPGEIPEVGGAADGWGSEAAPETGELPAEPAPSTEELLPFDAAAASAIDSAAPPEGWGAGSASEVAAATDEYDELSGYAQPAQTDPLPLDLAQDLLAPLGAGQELTSDDDPLAQGFQLESNGSFGEAAAPEAPAWALQVPAAEPEPWEASPALELDLLSPLQPTPQAVVDQLEEIDVEELPIVDGTDLLEELPPVARIRVEGTHRVVVHTVEGLVKRGVIADADLEAETLPLSPQADAPPEPLPTSKVKAVFFMLSPGEVPAAPEGKKVRVTFNDGRQIAGFSPDYSETGAGFFMIPADTRTNTGRIWVYRAAVKSVAIS
jgi:hypothetical protein